MPVALIDSSVAPQGAGIPNSPLVNMFGKAVNAYGQTFPNAVERSDIQYKNAETQKLQQQTNAGNAFAATFKNALASQSPGVDQQPVSADNTQEGPLPAPNLGVTTPVATPAMSTGDTMRKFLPDLVKNAADSGDVSKANNLALMMNSYMAGTPGDIAAQKPGQPTTQDMAMMASGHPYAATPGGVLAERSMGTPEMRNRNFKIQQIMDSQGISYNDAAAMADGVSKTVVDPVSGNMYMVNEATGTKRLISTAGAAGNTQNGGNPTSTTPLPQPGNTPASGQPLASAVAKVESNNNPNAVSPKGAVGTMQTMPATLKNPGFGVTPARDDSPEEQTRVGQDYLAALTKYYKGNQSLALMAYNWGPGNMDDVLAGRKSLADVPMETAQYVGKVNAAGGSPTATPTATPAVAAQAPYGRQAGNGSAPAGPASQTGLHLKPGDIPINFGSIYGGGPDGGMATRAKSAAGSLLTGDNDPTPGSADLNKLGDSLTLLAKDEAASPHPGQGGNTYSQKQIMQRYPITNPGFDKEDAVEIGATKPIDAENMTIGAVNRAMDRYNEATEQLKQETLPREQHSFYQTRQNNIRTALTSLLTPQQMAQTGITGPGGASVQAPAPASNYDQGMAAINKPNVPDNIPKGKDGIAAPMSAAQYAAIPAGTLYHHPDDPPGAQPRVKGGK